MHRWALVAIFHSAFLMLCVFHTFWRLCSWTLGYSSPLRKFFCSMAGTVMLLLVPRRRQRPLSAVSWQKRRAQIEWPLVESNNCDGADPVIQGHTPFPLLLALLSGCKTSWKENILLNMKTDIILATLNWPGLPKLGKYCPVILKSQKKLEFSK